ncbi:hypothetical protein [Mucilaginibacter humi]|uniref:hypothetical protein n=1 Tax=Mucilaginibacter humi TaxID=2732510 RepID=UPI001FE6B927|nr:hypothetical protein [Mucilaginibacter humi]
MKYAHNVYSDKTHSATSTMEKETQILDVTKFPGLVYYMPCPKSPHGVDVTPDGESIVASGKLAAVIPVFSYKKMLDAIDKKTYDGMVAGNLPVLKYEAVLRGEVKKPGLGPLHTEFDDKGFAYTTMFVSSEVVKWKVDNPEIIDRAPVFYSPGPLIHPVRRF